MGRIEREGPSFPLQDNENYASNLAWMGAAPYSSYSARVNHKPETIEVPTRDRDSEHVKLLTQANK